MAHVGQASDAKLVQVCHHQVRIGTVGHALCDDPPARNKSVRRSTKARQVLRVIRYDKLALSCHHVLPGVGIKVGRKGTPDFAQIAGLSSAAIEAHEVVSVLLDAVDEVVFKVQATGIEALLFEGRTELRVRAARILELLRVQGP